MDSTIVIDMLLGLVAILAGWTFKRIFILLDRLTQEDKILHARLTELATDSIGREEFQSAINRVIDKLERMENRLMEKQ
jgi:hypothetical protein